MSSLSKKIPISLLIALVGFPQISETIYTPGLPDVARSLNTTANLVEVTLSIYFLGFAFGVLVWGAVSDKIGRKPAMLIGIGFYGIATIICGQINSIEALMVWRFIQAFGASVGSVITQTILRDAYDGTERSKLFSIMSGALAFSPALGPLIGGFVSQYYGWRFSFILLSIVAGILFTWTFRSLRETRQKQVDSLSIAQLTTVAISMLRSRNIWGHILLISGANGILFGFYQEAPFVFIDQLGFRPSTYGLFGLLIAGATILASGISYKMNSVWSNSLLIRLGSCSAFGGAVLFTMFAVSGLIFAQWGMVGVILALFLIFFGIGLIIPASLSIALKPYQTAVGTAGSIFGGCYYCLIAICTWVMGIFHNGTVLILPGYITIIAAVVMLASCMIQEKSVNYSSTF